MLKSNYDNKYHTSARILVVDDDVSFIAILLHMLDDYSDQHFARSAIDGLRLAREINPDLIIIDYEMPDLGGADLCAMLRSDPTLGSVPIIFITSHNRATVMAATFRAGASDFITKPVSRSLLLARVREQLKLTRGLRNPAAAEGEGAWEA
jgi:putative two-component system response regulator